MSVGVQLLLLLTVLSLVPAILMMVTSFIRIAIVLSFARSAIGMPQMPPNQILLGLALFLTVFVMAPVWTTINDARPPAVPGRPDLAGRRHRQGQRAAARVHAQADPREATSALFVSLGKLRPAEHAGRRADLRAHPAFMISELKTAFQMGFLILLPFLVIDMVVSSTLMSMGMMMLPPTTISLPFKVLLFVMADGWYLISRSLVTSFRG